MNNRVWFLVLLSLAVSSNSLCAHEPPPAGIRVQIERIGGRPPVVGELALAAVRVTTDTGFTSINTTSIERITFQKDPGGDSKDQVLLVDKSIVRGRVVETRFEVTGQDSVQRLAREEITEIRVLRPTRPLSLTSAALGLATLTLMEIVLGIDNIIFLALIAGRLPEAQQPKARRIGLVAALGTRLLLLLSLTFVLGLTAPIFTLPEMPFLHDQEAREVSWRDLILLGGGLFLIGKSVREMHESFDEATPLSASSRRAGFARTIVTIAVIDIVFSLDSVITAVGMVESVWVMVAAMVMAMLVMLGFSGPIARFVSRYPSIKILALSFLVLIGVMLVMEGFGQHIDKGYIYFAMAFAVGIELLNMRLRGKGVPAAVTPPSP